MRFERRYLLVLLMVAIGGSLPLFARGEKGSQTTTLYAVSTMAGAPERTITMQAGHVHVFRDSKIRFTVNDPTTGQGVAGLSPEVYFQSTNADLQIGYWFSATNEGRPIVDAGDGTYEWTHEFHREDTYWALFVFQENGYWYLQWFHLHTSPAGYEAFFRPSLTDAEHSYQIRWTLDWNTPVGYPAATSTISFDFDVRKSFGPVNLQMPWRNKFELLRDDELTNLVVRLVSVDGEIGETLPVEYLGMGVFRVQRVFPSSEVPPEGRRYRVEISFIDPDGFLIDTSVEGTDEYEFTVRGVPAGN